jgi:hypothetical protein
MKRRTIVAAALAGFGLCADLGLAQSESASAIVTVSGDVPSPLHLKADDPSSA